MLEDLPEEGNGYEIIDEGLMSNFAKVMRSRRHVGRAVVIAMIFAAAVFSAACGDEAEREEGEGGAGSTSTALVTEGDSLFCGRTEDVYRNGTALAKELHVRARNRCHGRDTLSTDSMRVWVRSGTGQVVNGQDYRVPYDGTYRGTVVVTAGSSLRVECPRPLQETPPYRYGCSWQYQYVLR
jgi:hypothetical protein